MRNCSLWLSFALVLVGWNLSGAERKFEFSNLLEGKMPPGFRSAVTGSGKPGDWRIVMDDVPPLLAPLREGTHALTKRPVLAQLAEDRTDEHFPLLIYDDETFRDFTLTTRFKTVSGVTERMAGIAFRLQDETNYYVVRASSLGNTFRFYKVVDGIRSTLLGPEIPIPSGVWHDLIIDCKGTEIRVKLNGQELIPPLTDSSFTIGKIAFWVKSDSISYFADTTVAYTPQALPAQLIVRDVLKRYPKLEALKVFIQGKEPGTTRLIAAKDETEVGQAGGTTELDVLKTGGTYYGKGKETVVVTMPLRDRNGEIIAAVRVAMKSFPGQTQDNAMIRGAAVVKHLQERTTTLKELLE
jgi:hypothetical protein